MTHDEHRSRHQELHRNMDELYADYLRHNLPPAGVALNPKFFPVTINQIMEWSHRQTLDPDELEEANDIARFG